MTLYEMNQEIYSKAPPIKDFSMTEKIIENFLINHEGQYYMLLNHDFHYYTVFARGPFATAKDITKEILDIAKELGPVKEICLDATENALEFWIEYKHKTCVFLLFDYTRGVIEI